SCHERPSRQQWPGRLRLDPFALPALRRFDQRGDLRALLRENADRFRGETRSFERLNPLLRPLHILKYTNRKSSGIDVNHGDVIYHGGWRPEVEDQGQSLPRRSSDSSMSEGGRFDFAIVGAGPSGSWTATLLARSGANVLLIDPSHPREKPCGGGVTGRALAL